MGIRSLALAVLLGLLALWAYFVLGRARGEQRVPVAASHTPEEDEPANEPTDLEPTLAAAPTAAGRSAAQVGESDSSATQPVGLFESETLVLEVLDGRSNAPAADVTVRYASSERLRERGCLAQDLSRSAASTRTDSRGLARLRVPRAKSVEVVASAPGLLGEALFAARAPDAVGERRERLVLLPNWDLSVEVVDDALQPAAGVSLVLVPSRGGRGFKPKCETDEDGRATFADVGHELERSPGRALRVLARLPLEFDVEVLVEHEPPRGEAVRLCLPPLGSLEVEVLAADGTPIADMTRVLLHLVEQGAREPVFDSIQTSVTTRSGRVLFEGVPPGRRLALAAQRGAERGEVFLAGPQRSGERVQVTLRLGLEDTLLCFRALDAQREPVLEDLSASVCARAGGAVSVHDVSVSTGPDGNFLVRLGSELAEGERRELEVRARRSGLAARLDISRHFAPGRIELGDLVLEPPPLVAEGRVIDAAGQPVARARVSWVYARAEHASSAPESRLTKWDGTFTLRGFVEARRVHLLVEHGWLHCEPREVEVGTHGLELVLGATGGVAGRVLLDPGVPAGLAIELRQRGTRAVVGSSATKKDGSFECRRVPVGTYALAVARDGEVLSEVHDVVVLANEVAGDPRLAALDLRGRMHVFRIELVPPSPGFELNGSLRYMEAGAAGQGYARDFGSQQAPLEVLTSLPRIDAVLRVAGCRVERLADLGPRTEVRLRTGYPVRLALPVGVRLPAPPLFLGVALAGQDAGPLAEGAAFFDERGEAVIHAAEAGRATIAWVWERRRENGGMRAGLELPAQSFIEIEDRPGEQRFELALTNEALAAALKAR